jgi:hypothetical protein
MERAGMPLFGLDKVLPCFGGREVEGKDMRVPIGHGDGAFCLFSLAWLHCPSVIQSWSYLHNPCPAIVHSILFGETDDTGRMGQLGKIHYINTKAFLEAARHVMIEYGEYTDAEVDVLCELTLLSESRRALVPLPPP